MIIESMRVRKYKSINDSERITLHEKISVLAGKNNSGKTALVEAIYRCLQPSSLTMPNANNNQFFNKPWYVELIIRLEREEMDRCGISQHKIIVNLKAENGATTCNGVFGVNDDGTILALAQWSEQTSTYSYLDQYTRQQSSNQFPKLVLDTYSVLRDSVVFISGNRTVPSNPQISQSHFLDITASNLHTFLFTLHNNKEESFDAIQNTFMDIFDDVKVIRTPLTNNSTNINLEFHYNQLSIPIQECGSGFTHVLVYLAVLFSDNKKVIMFDEPHSFLHPSAEKAIYDLATQNQNHQFIFTTHSPILINYPISKYLYLTSKVNGLSQYNQLNDMQQVLNEVGVSNSDFALSEKVIFVEGQTEEKIIPNILGHFGMRQLGYNYRIICLDGSAAFSKTSTMRRTSDMYNKIFNSVSGVPIPHCILLDRDGNNQLKVEKLGELYKDKILVLKRWEIENYFINIDAIHSVLNFCDISASEGEVQKLVEDCLGNHTNHILYPKGCTDPIVDVKGSSVLNQIFINFGLEYNKIYHGDLIVKWLLENRPEELSEIAELLSDFIRT